MGMMFPMFALASAESYDQTKENVRRSMHEDVPMEEIKVYPKKPETVEIISQAVSCGAKPFALCSLVNTAFPCRHAH